MFEFYWLQKQQQTRENRKYIENTQLNEEHEINQLQEEHVCDEESRERSEGLTVIRTGKKQLKKMGQNLRKPWSRKSEAIRASEILPAGHIRNNRKKQFAWSLIEKKLEKEGGLYAHIYALSICFFDWMFRFYFQMNNLSIPHL